MKLDVLGPVSSYVLNSEAPGDSVIALSFF